MADCADYPATGLAPPAPVAAWVTDWSYEEGLGGLLEVSLEDGTVVDEGLVLEEPSAVHAAAGRVWIVDSVGARGFLPGAWAEPDVEWTWSGASEAWSLAVCGGVVWTPLADGGSLPAYDPETGAQVYSVDLSAYGGDDGLPVARSPVVVGDTLLLGTEQGAVAIACTTATVAAYWETGAATTVVRDHARADTALFLTGGAVRILDVQSGARVGPCWRGASGANEVYVSAVGRHADGSAFANIWERGHVRDEDGYFGIECLNQAWHLSGDVTLATRLLANTWRVLASDGAGSVWARGDTGISIVDTTSCDVRTILDVRWAQSVAFAEDSGTRR